MIEIILAYNLLIIEMLFLTKNNEHMLENAIFAVVLNFLFVLKQNK